METGLDAAKLLVVALPRTQKILLLLDYDGTLVPIAPRPELAVPGGELRQTLSRLAANPGLAAVIVSGRSLADLQKLLPVPGLNYLGSHGAEGLIGGAPWTLTADGGGGEEREELRRQLLRHLGDLPGWWLETKPWGFALHYRQAAPEEEARIMAAAAPWLERVAAAGRHQLLRGKKVVEILPRGVSKGAAIEEILVFPGFSGYFPVYLGDDVTDESAFQVLHGRGLTVKVGGGLGASAATHLLANPSEVLQFLALLAAPRKANA